MPIDAPIPLRQLVGMLTHPLNDALYRQQGLTWAAEAAREQGLHLGLYGNGWEKHPTLAEYARGPVAIRRPARRPHPPDRRSTCRSCRSRASTSGCSTG